MPSLLNSSGVVSGQQPVYLPTSSCMESTTTEGAPVTEGLPEEATALEHK